MKTSLFLSSDKSGMRASVYSTCRYRNSHDDDDDKPLTFNDSCGLFQNSLTWSKPCEQMCNYVFSLKDGRCIVFLSCSDYGALYWDDGSMGRMGPDHSSPRSGEWSSRIFEIYGRLYVSKKYTIILLCWDCGLLFTVDCLAVFSLTVIFLPGSTKLNLPYSIAQGKVPHR